MKKRNGWCYAFWILIIVVLILALAVGLIAWAGTGNKDEDGVDEDGVQPADPSEGDATVESVTLGDLDVAYGGEGTLTATVTMSDESEYEGDYAWSSDDPEIAAVSDETTSENFVTVTGVKCGTATIKVSVGEGTDAETATCTVTVSEDHETAESGRVSAVADGDERLTVGEGLAFSATSITATYDSETRTYTIDGVSETMGEGLAAAVYDASHAECRYITFEVVANAGETINIATYNGTTPEKTWTLYGGDKASESTTDGTFVLDLTDHTEGDWSMVLDVTYAGGDEISYTIVLGDIERGVADPIDLQAAINEGGEVALTEDIELESSLTIGGSGSEDVEVLLDLNGCALSFEGDGSNNGNHTIMVASGATLTVTGDGVVDATKAYTAALYNEGTVILEGGTFERSEEDAMEESKDKLESGYDSYYTIDNRGDLTIEDGAVVFNAGDYSTCLRNKSNNDTEVPATLTINGGKIYGGKFAVKNDYSGKLVMTGGQLGGLRSETDALPYRALDNYDEATITGGTLLGGNGGAIDVDPTVDGAVAEGLVIYNNSGAASKTGGTHDRGDEIGTLTICDEDGNGPEIIYEGINPKAAIEETKISYYDDDETAPTFATGIAIDSGTVNIEAGTIKCSDETAAEDRDYAFMGAYLASGALNVSGGEISGDVAIAIDCTAEEDIDIAWTVTGGQFTGDIVVYTSVDGDVVASVYTPGGVIVPSDSFEFNEETFDGISGLAEDFVGASGTEYKAGDITITWTVDATGQLTAVVDGIVANEMTEDQKIAFDASYSSDEGTIRFYIAVQIAVKPGETVTVTGGGKEETIKNDTDEVIYDLWVIEIGQSHFTDVTAETVGDYLVVDISTFTITVTVTDAENEEKGTYTIAFGNVFVPLQAWRCADGKHTVSSWTVTKEETCATEGSQTGTCDYCGATVEEVIPANGLHAATIYSDGNAYAVYMATEEGGEEYAWYAFCETCEQWFEIDSCDTCDIYDLVLVANSEASLNAAIAVAKVREDGSADNRTQILVYGEIVISDTSYVKIDCDNVEIYGLDTEQSKIIDSAYDGANPEGKDVATSGVEISGKNVTIRNLTIDGTALNDVSDEHTYKHAVEIKGGAENVLISGCVVIGGGTDLETDSSICIMEATGIVKIENCSLSGAYNGLVIEHNGQAIDITVSGGKIDAIRPIWIDGGNGVTLLVEDAEIYGRNSFGREATSIKFSNCTFGFHISDSGYIAYGAVSTYGDVTLEKCTFLSHETGTNLEDFPVMSSNNYAIQARDDGVTITIIDCEFENTHDDLDIGKLTVDEDNVIYIIAYLSYSFNVVFGDFEGALEYIYDSTSHAVEHNHIWVAGDEDETTGKTTYTCVCGATKTEVTGNHVVSATPSVGYIVTTVDGSVTAPEFTIVMSEESESYDSIGTYLDQSGISDTVTWSSSDTSVATVDATTGEVTILGTGVATITVKFEITELEASYTIYVGETIEETDPLIGSWHGTDEVKASVSIISLDLTVEVYVTVTENTFTLRVVESAMSIDETIWNNVAWFKAGEEYYIVVEEADGSYELIDISYSNDSGSEQLSTSFTFIFEYTLFGAKMDVTVDVENATMARVTESGS